MWWGGRISALGSHVHHVHTLLHASLSSVLLPLTPISTFPTTNSPRPHRQSQDQTRTATTASNKKINNTNPPLGSNLSLQLILTRAITPPKPHPSPRDSTQAGSLDPVRHQTPNPVAIHHTDDNTYPRPRPRPRRHRARQSLSAVQSEPTAAPASTRISLSLPPPFCTGRPRRP